MPRLSPEARAAMGIGDGPGSVDGAVLVAPGGDLCWLTADRLLARSRVDGAYQVVQVTLQGAVTPWDARPANELVAGGGRWLAWASGRGLFGSLPPPPPDDPGRWARAGLRGAGPDGTLAYCPDYQDGRGLVLLGPENSAFLVPGAVYAREVQVLGPAAALWHDGQAVQAFGVNPPPRPALRPGRLRRAVLPSGEVWLVYWAEGTGLIAQVDGALDGYVLETQPTAFNHDAVAAGDALVVAWSRTQGEGPGDLHSQVVDRSQPRHPLAAPPAQPTFHFTHPVRVRPFKAEGSGQPDLFTDGTYREGEVPDPPPEGRLLLAHDSPADWVVPAGQLRPWDVVLWELYRVPEETLAQSAARWLRQSRSYLAQWPGDCGVIPMFYDQQRWAVGEILDGLGYLDPVVNLSPRIKEIAPFAYDRANGIVKYPELQEAFDHLVAAAALAGEAQLTPVGEPVPPDPPDPPVPPDPPTPVGGFTPMTVFSAGGPMQTERGGIVGISGKFARSTKDDLGHGPFGWYALHWDADAPDGDAEFELTDYGDGTGSATHVATGAVYGMDITKFVDDIRKAFYLKPGDLGEPGGYERPWLLQHPRTGTQYLLVEFAQPDGGKPGFAMLGAWVKK